MKKIADLIPLINDMTPAEKARVYDRFLSFLSKCERTNTLDANFVRAGLNSAVESVQK